MSSSDRIRWGGLAGMLAGVAFIVLMLIPEGSPGSFLYVLNGLVYIIAVLFMLVGLAGSTPCKRGITGASDAGVSTRSLQQVRSRS